MRFEYIEVADWPPLAWVAQCSRKGDTVRVSHGAGVQTRTQWFCEAVWDGPFSEGEFHRTDAVFGSGGRVTERGIEFVSSGSTVDRLHLIRLRDDIWVSNTAVGLMAHLDARPDPGYSQYLELFTSIVHGLDRYQRKIPTTAGPMELVYYRNVLWDGTRATRIDKPNPVRYFSSFHRYKDFLDRTLAGLLKNLSDPARGQAYRPLATMSSGYDSPTICTMLRRHGPLKAFTLQTARGGDDDSGESIASHLDVCLHKLDRDGWRYRPPYEIPFLAADGMGSDVFFGGAADLMRHSAVFTGFHGDKLWDRETKSVGPDIVRGDPSGLSLSEFRLWIDCIHVTPCFLGVRQIADIVAISRSPEMDPWHVPGGYSRPICRRVVEEAGIPREMFGTKKKATSVIFYREDAVSESSASEFALWRKGRPNARRLAESTLTDRACIRLGRYLRQAVLKYPNYLWRLQPLVDRWMSVDRRDPSRRGIYVWAVEQAIQRYRSGSSPVHQSCEPAASADTIPFS